MFLNKQTGKIEVFQLNEANQEKIVRTIDVGNLFGKKDDITSTR